MVELRRPFPNEPTKTRQRTEVAEREELTNQRRMEDMQDAWKSLDVNATDTAHFSSQLE